MPSLEQRFTAANFSATKISLLHSPKREHTDCLTRAASYPSARKYFHAVGAVSEEKELDVAHRGDTANHRRLPVEGLRLQVRA